MYLAAKQTAPTQPYDLIALLQTSQIRSRRSYRRLIAGLVLVGLLVCQSFGPFQKQASGEMRSKTGPHAHGVAAGPLSDVDMGELFRTDVRTALSKAKAHHLATVRDYTCTLLKRERLGTTLHPEQVMKVRFRQQPYSVMMHWIRNIDRIERVIYVKNRWIDHNAARPDERALAICQPGALVRWLVKSVKKPIRGPEAKAAGRRFLDQFGFAKGLEQLQEYAGPKDSPPLLIYAGESTFDGRPTWVLERTEPYQSRPGRTDYRVAVFHIDQQWLVPVAAALYANAGRTKLVARYEHTNVRMNAGCSARDFDPATYGM